MNASSISRDDRDKMLERLRQMRSMFIDREKMVWEELRKHTEEAADNHKEAAYQATKNLELIAEDNKPFAQHRTKLDAQTKRLFECNNACSEAYTKKGNLGKLLVSKAPRLPYSVQSFHGEQFSRAMTELEMGNPGKAKSFLKMSFRDRLLLWGRRRTEYREALAATRAYIDASKPYCKDIKAAQKKINREERRLAKHLHAVMQDEKTKALILDPEFLRKMGGKNQTVNLLHRISTDNMSPWKINVFLKEEKKAGRLSKLDLSVVQKEIENVYADKEQLLRNAREEKRVADARCGVVANVLADVRTMESRETKSVHSAFGRRINTVTMIDKILENPDDISAEDLGRHVKAAETTMNNWSDPRYLREKLAKLGNPNFDHTEMAGDPLTELSRTGRLDRAKIRAEWVKASSFKPLQAGLNIAKRPFNIAVDNIYAAATRVNKAIHDWREPPSPPPAPGGP